MENNTELFLKVAGILISVLGLIAAVYNIVSGRTHQKRMAQENRELAKLDGVIVLSAKNEQRINALENRHNSLEARVDRRLDQIAGDIGKVKDLFTEYIIKNH